MLEKFIREIQYYCHLNGLNMNRTIIMLEDDEDDRYISQAVFGENHADVTLKFVSTSHELMSLLQTYVISKSLLPAMILLDYHASPLNAVEILKELKSEPAYKHIPIVVLSGSVHPDIIRDCYAHGASSFIQKPSANVENKISAFIRYWFGVVELV